MMGQVDGMVWVGGDGATCVHYQSEATVEGGLACVACGALLLPADQAEQGLERAVGDLQVKYKLRGHFTASGLAVEGEWDDLETAMRCAEEVSRLGGYAALYEVTTEELDTGVRGS